jgi:hypothetical protein
LAFRSKPGSLRSKREFDNIAATIKLQAKVIEELANSLPEDKKELRETKGDEYQNYLETCQNYQKYTIQFYFHFQEIENIQD